MSQQRKVIDRIGQKIGKLRVMSRFANIVERSVSGKAAMRAQWLCVCDCGQSIVVSSHSLGKAQAGKGGTSSCGCLLGSKSTKHGKFDSRVYRIWRTMKQRCTNPRIASYKDYGGRGIVFDPAWEDFQAFYRDMGDPPKNFTLERIDNSLGYVKSNCKWASRMDQASNRRTNRYIEFNGQKKSLAEWARFLGVTSMCLRGRLGAGWPVEKALTTPKHGRPFRTYRTKNSLRKPSTSTILN